jgi:hypothetical protein
MADYVIGSPALFNENTEFFKDVYIYGTLYNGTANFLGSVNFNESVTFNTDVIFTESITVPIINVTELLNVTGVSSFYGNSVFSGITTFKDNVTVNEILNTKKLYVSEYLGVGTDNNILNASNITGNVGIGSTIPEQKLDIAGSVKIDSQIYDSLNNSGNIGGFLTKDAQGIKWTDFEPAFSEGIFVYNDDVLVGIQSFRGLNLKTGRSAGTSTDPIQAFQNPTNANIADIYVYDYWDYDSAGNIYRNSNVGIGSAIPKVSLDVSGDVNITLTLDVDGATTLNNTLDVDGATTLNNTLGVTGATTLSNTLGVTGATTLSNTLGVTGATTLSNTLGVTGATTLSNTLAVTGATTLSNTLGVTGATTLSNTLGVTGATTLSNTLAVTGVTTLSNTLGVTGATSLNSTLQVGVAGTVITTTGIGSVGIGTNNPQFDIDLAKDVKFRKAIIDTNNSTAIGKTDYRLASVGTGVSWRPPGVQTQNAIWVTIDGNDTNSGYLEGDAKRTIGAAASIAESGDTIFVRSGVYYENNPIGLRTDVSVSGQDLRLVTVVPKNLSKDIFHVRRGCLIENLNFNCETGQSNPGGGALAFPPTTTDIVAGKSFGAVSGYLAPGPATEGSSGRWRSPYVRNCTNFMPLSIGMKINGDHATASTIGADLKCMVCDSFTQYNEAGIGVSLTNNAYAQLVSLFTINCDKAVYADSGGQCDLTNSNSSFGNYGLYAVGLGRTEFTGIVSTTTTEEADIITFANVTDGTQVRRPYDGQALWFKINLSNYATGQTGIITAPMQRLGGITVVNGGSGYSQSAPPDITIYDENTNDDDPLGPEGIIAEVSPTISDAGTITVVDIVNSGRNYLSSQNIKVRINGAPTNDLVAVMEPIYYTVAEATSPTVSGITTVTLNEFVPYLVYANDPIEMRRISRILTSTHSFEYIGAGTSINTATPQSGGVPIKANEIVALDGAQIPFTSTDQKGNFNIGEGIQVNQTTATITGRDFSKAIQAEVTPLILALR